MNAYIYCLMILGVVLQGIFIAVEHKEKFIGAVCLKGAASIVFCVIGALGFSAVMTAGYEGDFPRLVLIGLFFGALGDILLNLRWVIEKLNQKIFLSGIAAFLTGHILYLAALIPLSESLLICGICGIVLAAILLAVIFKTFEVKLAFKIFGILYLGAVILMTSIAIGNCITSGFETSALLYAIGAVLFTVSDVVLIFNTFGTESRFSLRITNLSLYYIGQLLIASSLFFI